MQSSFDRTSSSSTGNGKVKLFIMGSKDGFLKWQRTVKLSYNCKHKNKSKHKQ